MSIIVKNGIIIVLCLVSLDAIKKAGIKPEDVCEHRWRSIGLMLGPNGDPAGVVRSWSC